MISRVGYNGLSCVQFKVGVLYFAFIVVVLSFGTSIGWLSNVRMAYCKMKGWLPYAGRKYVNASIGATGSQYKRYFDNVNMMKQKDER